MNAAPRLLALAAASLLVTACAREEPAAEPANAVRAAPIAAAKTRAPASSAKPVAAAAPAAAGAARRCGWLHNPTPGNWWLVDSQGEWLLATQGREPVKGMDEIPDLSTSQWVETNGHYGYGCACLDVTAAPGTRQVVGIARLVPKPLAQCRSDKALPSP